jgi:hypothetical protein
MVVIRASRGLIGVGVALAVLGFAAGPAPAQSAQADPPARVGRLAQTSGTVSFHTADETQWQPATLNYPVTSGNSFWTEPRSHAAIDIGGGRLYLDSATELDIGRIDEGSFAAQLPQGAIYLRAPDASPSNQYEIDTPRGAVRISQPGDYEVIAGDTDHPTMVTVYQGSAQIQGPGVDMAVAPGQAVSITGQNTFQATTGQAPPPDDFITFVQGAEQPYRNAGPATNYVSPQETGYQDLNRYGSWQQTPSYGPVWIPQVSAGWAPYREGHWAYVEPWGWTWIDDAPWGFTPFHYGRWVEYDDQWAWVPGTIVAEPVYAPALVSFFGDFGDVGIGVGFGAVGWIPLAPEEVFNPWFPCSPRFIRNVNITNVTNVTIINNQTVVNNFGWDHFHNRRGGTFVSADVMTRSRPVDPAFRQAFRQTPHDRLQQAWSHARPLDSGRLVRPTSATAGVTPGLAHRLGIAGAPNQAASRRAAPGPNLAASQQRFQALRGAGGAGFQNRNGQPPAFAGQGGAGGSFQNRSRNPQLPAFAGQGGGAASRPGQPLGQRPMPNFAQGRAQGPLAGSSRLPTLMQGQQPGAFATAGGQQRWRQAPNFAQGNRSNLPPLTHGQPGSFGQFSARSSGGAPGPAIYRQNGGVAANQQRLWQGRNNFGNGQGLHNGSAPVPSAQTRQWQGGNAGSFAAQQPALRQWQNGNQGGNVNRNYWQGQGGNQGFASQQAMPRQWQGNQGGNVSRNYWQGQGGNRGFASQQAMPRQWQGNQGGGFSPNNWQGNRSFASQQAMPRQWQGNQGGGFSPNNWQGNRSFAPQQAMPRAWQGNQGSGFNPNVWRGGNGGGFAQQQMPQRQWQGGNQGGGAVSRNWQGGGNQPQRPASNATPQWWKKP